MSYPRYFEICANFNTLKRGSGNWKLNISHLKKEDYKEDINSIFNQLDTTLDASSKLDLFKVKFGISL